MEVGLSNQVGWYCLRGVGEDSDILRRPWCRWNRKQMVMGLKSLGLCQVVVFLVEVKLLQASTFDYLK